MDYAIGSVAALISGNPGNVTPSRPKLIKRALTPTKHQPSPNITPKSEFVDDRSIFLSPSLQKKKAMVKKSPKRIFQNPDLDVTNGEDGSSTVVSPQAEKVKKHLKEELEADGKVNSSPKYPKSPKKFKGKLDKSLDYGEPSKINISNSFDEDKTVSAIQSANENTPKKKKLKRNSISAPAEAEKENITEEVQLNVNPESTVKKSSKKKRKSQNSENTNENTELANENDEGTPKKKKKNAIPQEDHSTEIETKPTVKKQQNKKKKNRKGKKKSKLLNKEETGTNIPNLIAEPTDKQLSPKKKKKTKNVVNPNAITNKDSDSEHESDDDIESENEQANNEILDTGPVESSDDDAEEDVKQTPKHKTAERSQENEAAEIKRTLFVGNVRLNKKCKKEIKKIFSKYGAIDTVRIRTVPVKDARVTPKVAAIKNELHPDRTTVNVYVRFKEASSVDKALVENNTVLNDHHLRVSRSDSTGMEHDPRKAIFIGNMPFAIEDDTLRAKFGSCGEIESVRVVRDSKTNAGKGFGYVNFTSKDGVELALAMSEEDLTIKNRILRVKRCSVTNKNSGAKQSDFGSFQGNQRNQTGPGRSQGMKKRHQEGFGRNQGGFERNQGGYGRNQGGFGRNQGSFGRNQGSFGRNQGSFGRNQGSFGRNQGSFDRNQGGFGRNQGSSGRDQGNFGSNQNEDRSQGQDGAHRRIIKKRQNEEGGGPPTKRPNTDQPAREKKPRKEFVGMTAEKKKKQKFNKGEKKKKALSEILTKYSDK